MQARLCRRRYPERSPPLPRPSTPPPSLPHPTRSSVRTAFVLLLIQNVFGIGKTISSIISFLQIKKKTSEPFSRLGGRGCEASDGPHGLGQHLRWYIFFSLVLLLFRVCVRCCLSGGFIDNSANTNPFVCKVIYISFNPIFSFCSFAQAC